MYAAYDWYLMLPVIVYAAACDCIDWYTYCIVIYETIERMIYAAISASYERGATHIHLNIVIKLGLSLKTACEVHGGRT